MLTLSLALRMSATPRINTRAEAAERSACETGASGGAADSSHLGSTTASASALFLALSTADRNCLFSIFCISAYSSAMADTVPDVAAPSHKARAHCDDQVDIAASQSV